MTKGFGLPMRTSSQANLICSSAQQRILSFLSNEMMKSNLEIADPGQQPEPSMSTFRLLHHPRFALKQINLVHSTIKANIKVADLKLLFSLFSLLAQTQGLSKFAKLARSVTRSRQFSSHLPTIKDTTKQSNLAHVSAVHRRPNINYDRLRQSNPSFPLFLSTFGPADDVT
jgi:hypothetical protein